MIDRRQLLLTALAAAGAGAAPTAIAAEARPVSDPRL